MSKNVKTTSSQVTWTRDELSQLPTTSSKVRFLSSKGESRSEISKILNIRYQHVRNVLTTELKKS